MATSIEIDGKPYVTKAQVLRTPIRDFSPSFRTDTVPRREDRKDLAAIEFPHFLGGFGSKYNLAKDPRVANKFWDSQNVMTHWLSQLSLSFASNTATAAMNGSSGASLKGPIAAVDYKGELYGLFEASKSGVSFVHTRLWDAGTATWGIVGVGLGSPNEHSGTVATAGTNNSETVTVTVDGAATVLTEGTHWNAHSDAATEATSIAAAIDTVAGVWTSRVTGTITVHLEDDRWTLGLAESAPSNMTATPPSARSGTEMVGDMIVQGGNLVCCIVDATAYKCYTSVGLRWTAASASPSPVITQPTAGDNDALAKMVVIDTDIYLAVWDEANAQIEVWKSTDDGDNYSALANAIITSGGGPRGKALFPDRTGEIGFVFGSAEGVYVLDTSAGTLSLIEPLLFNTNHCWGMAVAQGKLFVSTGQGGAVAIRFDGTSLYSSEEVGPDLLDGLPTARQGYFLQFLTAKGFVIGSYGGHAANKNASILMYNSAGWHNLHYAGTANIELRFIHISSADDDTERLHWSAETATATTTVHYQNKPLNNPGDGGAYTYAANGLLLIPEQSLNLPEVPSAWLVADADAINLGVQASAEEFVTIDYGVQGAAWQATELGHFETGVLTLNFGSGLGVSSPTLRPSMDFRRTSGDSSLSPFMRTFTLSLRKVYPTRYAYRTIIDVEATWKAYPNLYGKKDTVTSNLEALQDNILQKVLKYGEQVKNVSPIKDWEYREILGETAPPRSENVVDTDVVIHFVELI